GSGLHARRYGVEPSLGRPPASGKLLLFEEIQGLLAPRVVDSSDLRHRLQASKDVITVVERIVKTDELWVHHPTTVSFEEQLPAQEHLRRAHGRGTPAPRYASASVFASNSW